MNKFIVLAALICLAIATPAAAQTQGKHAVGDMYTRALNAMEAKGMLGDLNSPKQVLIVDMYIDHGQVLVTLLEYNVAKKVVFDLIASRIVEEKKIENN